ncbi:Rv1733c family protein [Streptomyces sp. XH2]|uniref:Rv1733c family protein n=1 Tax=Streptomyces sp. XH2 TaxID=3412483 RepID=UPI003C7A5998
MTSHRTSHRHRPMRRDCDRYQGRLCACLLLLLALALAVVPYLVGRITYAATMRTAVAQSASRHQVTAHSAGEVQGTSSAFGNQWAPVRWTDGRGVSHLGFTDVPGDTPKGGTVQVWVDRENKIVKPPATRQEALATGCFTGTAAAMALLLVFFGARGGLIAAIDRKRYEQWAAEWQVVEPLWSKRLPT